VTAQQEGGVNHGQVGPSRLSTINFFTQNPHRELDIRRSNTAIEKRRGTVTGGMAGENDVSLDQIILGLFLANKAFSKDVNV
jgi:hypothetical protein